MRTERKGGRVEFIRPEDFEAFYQSIPAAAQRALAKETGCCVFSLLSYAVGGEEGQTKLNYSSMWIGSSGLVGYLVPQALLDSTWGWEAVVDLLRGIEMLLQERGWPEMEKRNFLVKHDEGWYRLTERARKALDAIQDGSQSRLGKLVDLMFMGTAGSIARLLAGTTEEGEVTENGE